MENTRVPLNWEAETTRGITIEFSSDDCTQEELEKAVNDRMVHFRRDLGLGQHGLYLWKCDPGKKVYYILKEQ